jgi:tyrosine-protein kinase Etk/Wzc
MDDRQLSIKVFWDMLWPYRKMIIRNVSIIIVISIVWSLLLPNWYKATSVVLPPTSDSKPLGIMSMISNAGLGGFLGGDESLNKILSILKSQRLLEALAIKYDLMKKYDVDNMEETLKILSDNIDVSVEDEMQIAVSFWDKDQERVSEMTNYIIFCLDSLNIILSTGKAKNKRKFIESRIEEVLDSLRVLELEIAQFMHDENILSLTDQLAVGVQNAADLKAQIMAKEIELTIAKNTFEKSSAVIKNIQNEVNGYKEKYREFFQDNSSDKLLPNFSRVPEVGIKFTRLQRQLEYYVRVLEFLAPEYESSKIEETKNIPTIQILDRAVRPERKDKPKRSLIVLGAMALTLIFSLYVIYWKEVLRVKLKYTDSK